MPNKAAAGAGVDPVFVDWKRRFEAKVSDEIEAKALHKRKLAEAQLELDRARAQIARLEEMVRELTPAQAKLDKAIKDRRDADAVWVANVAERDAEISRLKTHLGRGQRQVLEDVMQWISAKADRLPEPVRAEEIELDPPVEAVFS